MPFWAGMSCASRLLPCLSSWATTIWAELKRSLLSDFSDHREWPINLQPSVWTVHGLLKSKITSTLLLVLKQDVTLIWSFCNKLPVQCQVPCILLIIQNLNVTLKSVAYLMSPPKRCVVNVKLVVPQSFLPLIWISQCGFVQDYYLSCWRSYMWQ